MWIYTGIHDIINQKFVMFKVSAVETSNPA
jgi:hypothetical protein